MELQQAQRQRTLQQQQQQQQNIMHVTYQSVPMLSLPANAGYNYSSLELTDIDSSLLNDIPLSPFETNSLLIQDMPSPSTMMPQLVNSPPIQMPEVQYLTPVQTPQQSLPLMPTLSQSAITPVNSNNSLAVVEPKPICPPGFGFLSSSCSLQKYPCCISPPLALFVFMHFDFTLRSARSIWNKCSPDLLTELAWPR